MGRDAASPTGLAGERRKVPRSEGKGTERGTQPGTSKAKGCSWCLRSSQGTEKAGRDRGGDGTFARPRGPRDEHPRAEGPTPAPKPPPGSWSSQRDGGTWDPGWGWVQDRGTRRGPRTRAGVPVWLSQRSGDHRQPKGSVEERPARPRASRASQRCRLMLAKCFVEMLNLPGYKKKKKKPREKVNHKKSRDLPQRCCRELLTKLLLPKAQQEGGNCLFALPVSRRTRSTFNGLNTYNAQLTTKMLD